MPGVEAADFDCAGCGATWTGVARLHPGGAGEAFVLCPGCGAGMGTMRCDFEEPVLQARPANEANVGFVRVYGGDPKIMMQPRERVASEEEWK